jgi:hypothetical protein
MQLPLVSSNLAQVLSLADSLGRPRVTQDTTAAAGTLEAQ